MRPPISTLGVAFVALAVLVTPPALLAHKGHEHATGVVKERMEVMESMAKAQKAIAQRLKASRELDLIATDARSIQELAGKISPLFPPNSREPPSEAKASIWQNWSDFERKAQATATEAGKLAATAPHDVRVLTAQARAVSQACGACHELYRAKK
jgi:cytochrome c556